MAACDAALDGSAPFGRVAQLCRELTPDESACSSASAAKSQATPRLERVRPWNRFLDAREKCAGSRGATEFVSCAGDGWRPPRRAPDESGQCPAPLCIRL